LDQTQTITF